MHKIRHSLLFAAMLCAAFLFEAKAEMTVIVTTDTEEISAGVSSVTSIKFAEGNMDFIAETPYSWPMNKVVSVKFNVPSSISAPVKDASALKLRREGDVLYVDGLTANSQPGAAIISLTGVKAYDNPQWNGEGIDISALPVGIYFLKTNDTTFKFIR